MVSIGFWERAFAGEVFYWIPERSELSCYQCFVNALGDISGRQSVNRRFYTTETDLSKVNFMPGISVDIIFVSSLSEEKFNYYNYLWALAYGIYSLWVAARNVR